MERRKRLRKELGVRILEEEEKKDGRESKKNTSKKNSTNESSFKNLGHHTPPKSNRGGNTSGMSNGSRPSQNISNIQPQSQMSPSLDQRMDIDNLGLGGKK